MKLVEIVFLVTREGQPHRDSSEEGANEFTNRFGGVTAFTRAGRPVASRGTTKQDEIFVFEVIADAKAEVPGPDGVVNLCPFERWRISECRSRSFVARF